MTARPWSPGSASSRPTACGTEDVLGGHPLAAVSGIGRITRFDAARYPARLAGEVAGFDAADHLPSRLLPQTDRMTRLALVAADWALADAGVDPRELARVRHGRGHRQLLRRLRVRPAASCRTLWSKGGRYVSAYQSFAWFYAVNTGQISIRNGMRGPSGVRRQRPGRRARRGRAGPAADPQGHPAGGLRRRRRARCARGAGSPRSPSGRLSTSERPGAGLPALRRRRRRLRAGRGRRAPGRRGRRAAPGPAGPASTARSPATARPSTRSPGSGRRPGSAPGDRTGAGRRRPDARPRSTWCSPTPPAIPELDRIEAEALTAVFGPRAVPVTAPKTMTGRLLSGRRAAGPGRRAAVACATA